MSHELEMIDGQAQMAYVGEVPWHTLGKQVRADLTPAQFQKEAGLDWGVKKIPLSYYTKLPNDKTPKSNKSPVSALVRESDMSLLDVVPNNWKPVQNDDAFAFFNDFIKAGEMEMHTAGSIYNGKNVWALAKIKSGFTLFGGDEVEGYLLFSNPHKYGKSITIQFTPIRVVCNNTLTMALGMKNIGFSQSHRKEFNADFAKKAIGITSERMAKYKEQAEFLGSARANVADINNYLAATFPSQSKKEESEKLSLTARRVLEVMETQPGAEYAQGSWWQVFNAATYYLDHQAGDPNSRLNSIWFGPDANTKIKALRNAMEFAKNSKALVTA